MRESLPEIVVSDEPSPTDCESIMNGLAAYNLSRGPSPAFKPLAILLRDRGTGETIGGLLGKIVYGWAIIDDLFVPEHWRRQSLGSLLLRKAEDIARAHECVGFWLNTFEFQARGFYEKNGFEIFGELDHFPPGSKCYFMRKHFDAANSTPNFR